jgi:hypothetical protein
VTVFDGGLADGWMDWGWGRHELDAGHPARISFEGFGGFILHHEAIDRSFDALTFRYDAPDTFGDFLQVELRLDGPDKSLFPSVPAAAFGVRAEGGKREVSIPWSTLNPTAHSFDRIIFSARLGVSGEWVLVDKVVLEGAGASLAAVHERRVPLAIRCDAASVRISPLIYGVAGDTKQIGAPAQRAGGNTMSRMNWDLGAWNAGSDWFFENTKGDSVPFDWFEGPAKAAIVVPMIGWVSKDATSVGFPRSVFPSQKAFDESRGAGNGVSPSGADIEPRSPAMTSIPAPPELIGQWIARLRRKDESRKTRSVVQYILDNEPALWHLTHRDVHPEPVSYDELLARTIGYATAIRHADPSVPIAGPAEWGWTGYFYSAKDRVSKFPNSDHALHGGVDLLQWYLQKLAEHEKATGTRLLDIVDVHFYPQADGVYSPRADAGTAARRLRSTRALWDPSYTDESWIEKPVNLIPRLKAWIAESYPGRGISIGEWNFGAEAHISGALAIAEVLGRFGQQGVTSAFYWTLPKPDSFAFQAFRAFLNFDGRGGHFLDWAVPTTETADVSLFASRDETKGKLIAILINKSADEAARPQIDVSTCGKATVARSFVLTGARPALESAARPDAALPPYSLEVIEYGVTGMP